MKRLCLMLWILFGFNALIPVHAESNTPIKSKIVCCSNETTAMISGNAPANNCVLDMMKLKKKGHLFVLDMFWRTTKSKNSDSFLHKASLGTLEPGRYILYIRSSLQDRFHIGKVQFFNVGKTEDNEFPFWPDWWQ